MKQRKSYFLLFTLLAILFVSCKDETEQITYAPTIEDQHDFLNVRVKELFLNYEYPPGLVPVIHTAENIPLLETGVYADRYFKEYSKIHPEGKAFKKRGFLIVVSRDPDLIQVRLGSVYRTYCNMRGVTAGPDYLQLQSQLHEIGTEKSVSSFLDMISTKVTAYNELSSGQKLQINKAVTFINTSLQHLGTPSENLYGKYFLKPSLKCVSWLYSLTESWFGAFLFIAFILLLARFIVKKVLGLIFKNPAAVNFFQVIIWGILSLIYTLSSTASAVILSSGRMEDYLALHALGIPFLQNFQIAAEEYVLTTPFISAICFIILFLINNTFNENLMLSLESGEKQRETYSKLNSFQKFSLHLSHNTHNSNIDIENSEEPYSMLVLSKTFDPQLVGGITFAAFFILPKPLILMSIALLISPIITKLIRYYKTINKNNISREQKRKRIIKLFSQFAAIVFFTGIVSIITYFLNPIDDKNEEQLIRTEQMDEKIFDGEYTLSIKHNGKTNQQLTARFEKQKRNKYRLTVNWPEGTKEYSATYNKKGQTFLSDEMGPATVFFYEEFNKLFIIFTPAANTTWELEK